MKSPRLLSKIDRITKLCETPATGIARSSKHSSLIISGYAEVDGVASDLPRLTKPFRQEQLAAMLSRNAA
jgi:hypothetical protein